MLSLPAAPRSPCGPRRACQTAYLQGREYDCYVLNDEARTAVISQRDMGAALGLGNIGSRLPRFISGKVISNFVGPELRQKLEQPVIFQAQVGGPEILTQVHGYDVTILIDFIVNRPTI